MIQNEKVKKAEEELEYLTGDAETKRLAELREKGIRDELAALKKAERESREARIETGIEQSKIEIAKKLLKNNVKIEIIMNSTGLSKEEIKNLK